MAARIPHFSTARRRAVGARDQGAIHSNDTILIHLPPDLA